MTNSIYNISEYEAYELKKNSIDTLFIEINASKIRKWEDYIIVIKNKFNIIDQNIYDMNTYINVINNLNFDKQEIIIVVKNYMKLLENNKLLADNIICSFKNNILPWWDEFITDEGDSIPFNVYVLDYGTEIEEMTYYEEYLNELTKS